MERKNNSGSGQRNIDNQIFDLRCQIREMDQAYQGTDDPAIKCETLNNRRAASRAIKGLKTFVKGIQQTNSALKGVIPVSVDEIFFR